MLIRAPGLARNGSLGQRQRLKRGGHLRNRAVWRTRPKGETAERRCVVAHSRFPKLTNPASLREGAGYSVSPQRPIGKRETPLLVPSQAAQQRAVNCASRRRQEATWARATGLTIRLSAGRVRSNRAWSLDPAGPSPRGERRRECPPTPALLLHSRPFLTAARQPKPRELHPARPSIPSLSRRRSPARTRQGSSLNWQ